MQGTAPLIQTSRVIDYGGGPSYPTKTFDSELEWNLGHMVNMGPSYAIGGTISGGTGGGDVPAGLTGLKLRVRRWLGSDLSLEVEGGLLWNDAGGALSNNVGGTAALRFNIRDQGSFYLRWDMVPITAQSMSYYDFDGRSVGGFADPGGAQHALSIGVGTGTVPALMTTGLAALTYPILFYLLCGNCD